MYVKNYCTDCIAFSTKRLKEIDLESPPVSVAVAPRTATEGEGLDSSMEEGLTSLPAAEAAAAAAFAAACEYPNTIGQTKFSSGHKNSNFLSIQFRFYEIEHIETFVSFIPYFCLLVFGILVTL